MSLLLDYYYNNSENLLCDYIDIFIPSEDNRIRLYVNLNYTCILKLCSFRFELSIL